MNVLDLISCFQIPAGSDRATTLSADPMAVNVNTRFCGRHFGIFPARTQSSAVCSKLLSLSFKMPEIFLYLNFI